MREVLLVISLAVLVNSQTTVPRNARVDCLPAPGATKAMCLSKGCLWDDYIDPNDDTVPLCYLPRKSGYVAAGSLQSSIVKLQKDLTLPPNPYDTDIDTIYVSTPVYGATLNVKIGPMASRYEPKIPLPRTTSTTDDPLQVFKNNDTGVFSFTVKRVSTGTVIWDTSIGGMFFGDKFIQIATFLPTDKIYGFGENIHQTLKHDFTHYLSWGMLARDEPPDSAPGDFRAKNKRKNLYGVHPFYIGLESDNKAHGVLILNSNAQDITTGPAPHLVYRTIGGLLDIYFFPGPKPEEVIKQYTAFIGNPFLPAYFALGFQLSRYGYKSLDEMKKVVQRVQNYGIPLDIPYADIDYMDRYKDFTTGSDWSDFGNYAKQLHSDGLHLFLIFDPAIQADYMSFSRARDMNVSFIEWERDDQVQHSIQDLYPLAKDTKTMLGVVWPDGHTAFPDFLDPKNNTLLWWIMEFQLYHAKIPFDGIWIDMNEPACFGTNEDYPWYFDNPDHPNIESLKCPLTGSDNTYDLPPYKTHAVYNYGSASEFLSSKTICMCGKSVRGSQYFYNTKNLYGLSESIATQSALYAATGKRGAVISRSTFPSSGRYAGHWLGDNTASWDDLRTSVIGAQEFNMFGITYVGSDICGFLGTTTEELCLRWQQMGAFHSFSRNHNDKASSDQDPGVWPSVASATKQANLFRYHYLPYLYTYHFDAAIKGGTVVRPVFFEFPDDTATHELSYQFMWGCGMMIIPVLTPGATTVSGYLPVSSKWYNLRDNGYGESVTPGYVTFESPTTQLIPVLVRGGFIIPRQAPSTTTTASRLNPFELLIALNSQSQPNAAGKFYWDDGESIVRDINTYENYYFWKMLFNVTDAYATLKLYKLHSTTLSMPTLDIIEVFGYDFTPNLSTVTLDGQPLTVDMSRSSYDATKKVLKIGGKGLVKMEANSETTVSWYHSKA